MREYPALFSSFELGSLTLPNRVVMAPMTRNASPEGVPGPDVGAYYARRAAGGVALIITEGMWIDEPDAVYLPSVPQLGDNAAQEGLRAVTSAVHGAGGRILAQLWHVGLYRSGTSFETPEHPAISPSGRDWTGAAKGRAMDDGDIGRIIEGYARSAAQAKEAGFDGIEVHGAHGYLLDQFFSTDTNQRDDRYGAATFADRTRLAAEVVAAIKQRTGPDFVVSFRMSQWKLWNYDAKVATTPDELAAWTTILAEAGVDVFHCSTRRYWEPEFSGSELNLAGWVKKLTGRPVITVGSVGLDQDLQTTLASREAARTTSLNDIEKRLERGEFDLVAVGRALITNPDWAALLASGRESDIKPFDPRIQRELY